MTGDGPPAAEPLLELATVSSRIGGALLLDRVSLSLELGALVGLIGPSGAGKTVLFDVVGGVRPRTGGSVRLGGRALDGGPAAITRQGVGRSFERPQPLPGSTVLQSIALAVTLAEGAGPAATLLRPEAPPARHQREAARVLRAVGLEPRADHPPHALPPACASRLELARALVARPRLLLLDQPARGLDADERQPLADLIQRLNQDGLTILLAEHDLGMIGRLCPRVVVLDHGRKIADGAPEEVGRDPEVLHAFAGTAAP